MDNSISGAVFTPSFYQTHLTDEEISVVLGVTHTTLRHNRRNLNMPIGTRHPADVVAFTGRTIRLSRNYTPVEQFKEWLVAHRPTALVALNNLIADKAASSEQGE